MRQACNQPLQRVSMQQGKGMWMGLRSEWSNRPKGVGLSHRQREEQRHLIVHTVVIITVIEVAAG